MARSVFIFQAKPRCCVSGNAELKRFGDIDYDSFVSLMGRRSAAQPNCEWFSAGSSSSYSTLSLSDTGTQLTQKLYSQVTKTPGCQEKVKKYQAIFCNDLTCYFYDILLPIFYTDHVLAALLGRKTSERPHYSIDSFYTITQCAAWLCVNFHVLRCRFVIHDITAQTMFNHLQTITIFEC